MDFDDIESTSSDDDDIFGFNKPRTKVYERDKSSSSQSKLSTTGIKSLKFSDLLVKKSRSPSPIKNESSAPKNEYSSSRKPNLTKKYVDLPTKGNTKVNHEDFFNIDVPTIFKIDGSKLNRVNKEHKEIKKIFENQTKAEQNIKLKHEWLKVQLLRELNEDETIKEYLEMNNGSAIKKFDIIRDNSYLEKLIEKDKLNIDGYGINRHFYCLKNVEVNETTQSEFNSALPNINRSLKYLISNNPDLATNYLTNSNNLKSFIFKSLFSTNINYLESILDLIKGRNKFTISNDEFDQLIEIFGFDFNLLLYSASKNSKCNNLPIKIDQINQNLKLQLLRITILFQLIMNNEKDNINFFKLFKISIYLLIDYNLNKYELIELSKFVVNVFSQLIEGLEENKIIKSLYDIITNLRTQFPPKTNTERVKKVDYELQYNVIKLLNITFLMNNTQKLQDISAKIHGIIIELNLKFLIGNNYNPNLTSKHSRENILYQISNNLIITENITISLQQNDLEVADKIYWFYYKCKILLFLLINMFNLMLTKKENIKLLKSIKVSIEKIQQNCYELIRKLGGINIDLVIENMNKHNEEFENFKDDDSINGNSLKYQYSFNREEMVNFLTDIHQDLSLAIDKLDYDLKLINNDLFYGS
ncbi:hypothetical protein KGF54_000738 [Candida jiufengensis]|uniref:uncharacterized protein n=1 Tax=Candida jiufengensis TaxID=497108 RepID=UPI0022246164|nr:uncharacterized protein KGF54_000738 [Candida jiufengensis]KAI5956263.1 hypothetical protein KGF54_000738 [Candida jiufengensis]